MDREGCRRTATQRLPARFIEAGFHAAAIVVLLVADRCSWWPGRRLAA